MKSESVSSQMAQINTQSQKGNTRSGPSWASSRLGHADCMGSHRVARTGESEMEWEKNFWRTVTGDPRGLSGDDQGSVFEREAGSGQILHLTDRSGESGGNPHTVAFP